MDIERTNYLFFVENKRYTIKIHNREDGYNYCFYRIITDLEYKLNQCSNMKIVQRLVWTFGLHIEEFDENEINEVMDNLEEISTRLRVKEDYINSLIQRYWKKDLTRIVEI